MLWSGRLSCDSCSGTDADTNTVAHTHTDTLTNTTGPPGSSTASPCASFPRTLGQSCGSFEGLRF